MLSFLKPAAEKIFAFNLPTSLAGVECVTGADGVFTYHFISLEIKKGIVSITAQKKDLDSVKELRSALPHGLQIALVLGGRGIIHKKLSLESETPDSMIATMLPNARAGEFYFQVHRNDFGNFCSIARKSAVDLLLEEFSAAGLPVIACSLGPWPALCLLPLLNQTGSLQVRDFNLVLKDNVLYDFSVLPPVNQAQEIFIGTEKTDATLLLPYAAAFQQLVPGMATIEADIGKVTYEKEELNQKKLFSKLGWGVLAFFLLALLVNFVLFSVFTEKNNELLSRQSQFQGMLATLANLEKEVKEKETFLGNAGWLSNSSATRLSDRIAGTVPASVRLTELNIYPFDERKSRTDRKELFDPAHVRVAGICSRPTDLNPWLNRMDKLPGIEKANVSTYFFDPKEKQGNFIITITLTE